MLLDDTQQPKKRNVQREHIFQAVVDRFLDRVVLPPMWTTGINHENELTDNARARARGRGVKGGVFDIYICQARGMSLWLECKWGSNKPSDAQQTVWRQLTACGISAGYCWSINDVLNGLRFAGFSLHSNAENLAVEYQARAEAAVATAELRAARPRSVGSKPRERASAAAVKRAHRWNAARLGL
jgi:hypothetical protein